MLNALLSLPAVVGEYFRSWALDWALSVGRFLLQDFLLRHLPNDAGAGAVLCAVWQLVSWGCCPGPSRHRRTSGAALHSQLRP